MDEAFIRARRHNLRISNHSRSIGDKNNGKDADRDIGNKRDDSLCRLSVEATYTGDRPLTSSPHVALGSIALIAPQVL